MRITTDASTSSFGPAATASDNVFSALHGQHRYRPGVQGFRLLVGRAQRIVEGTDALPQFPPLSDFTPTPWGRWIQVQ